MRLLSLDDPVVEKPLCHRGMSSPFSKSPGDDNPAAAHGFAAAAGVIAAIDERLRAQYCERLVSARPAAPRLE